MLYLVQHGDAVLRDKNPDRPLSDQGDRDIRKIANFLSKAGISVDKVLHSGKTRAKQTAEILAHVIAESGAIVYLPGLDPNDSVEPIAHQIEKLVTPTMIVGHLPFMAKLVGFLITHNDNSELIAYQPGTVVCLEKDKNARWQIHWMIRPSLIL